MAVTRVPPGFQRNSWEQTWMNLAIDVGKRSACTGAQIGAVIVSDEQRVVATGYNGTPKNYPLTCHQACPRKLHDAGPDGYESCISIHAEANALLHSPRAEREGGTLYVSSVICMGCAKMVANSGIARVVMRVGRGDAHRQPERSVWLLRMSGLTVDVWTVGKKPEPYRDVFFDAHGVGPFDCYFCEEPLAWVEIVHHKNHDHFDDRPENLAPSHRSCHGAHHKTDVSQSTETIAKIHDPRLRCDDCGHESTRAGMGRHQKARQHVGTTSVDKN